MTYSGNNYSNGSSVSNFNLLSTRPFLRLYVITRAPSSTQPCLFSRTSFVGLTVLSLPLEHTVPPQHEDTVKLKGQNE